MLTLQTLFILLVQMCGSSLCAGMKGATLKGDDTMEDVLHVMDHDNILFFTQDGKVRSLKAYQIPEASRTAAGSAITQVHLAIAMNSARPYIALAEISY